MDDIVSMNLSVSSMHLSGFILGQWGSGIDMPLMVLLLLLAKFKVKYLFLGSARILQFFCMLWPSSICKCMLFALRFRRLLLASLPVNAHDPFRLATVNAWILRIVAHLGQANLRSSSEIQPLLRTFLQANFTCTEQLPQVMMFTFKPELSHVSVSSFQHCMRYASDVLAKSSSWLHRQAWLSNAFFLVLIPHLPGEGC